ncbi:MAG: hypothetical protein AAF557_05150 [Pseudomonadota bacterium]
MTVNHYVIGFVVLWAVLVATAFIHAALYDPTGNGLAGGFAVIFIFLGWQIGALFAAFAALIIRLIRQADVTGAARWLGVIPAVLSGGFALFIVGWVTFAG